MINTVLIEVIPHKKQAYDTAGDYRLNGKTLVISVSETGNWLFNMAIAIHELVEAVICHYRGVKFNKVDAFDIEYEKKRPEGNTDEPGDDKNAPYRHEHSFATAAERMVIAACEENWQDYDNACLKLQWTKTK